MNDKEARAYQNHWRQLERIYLQTGVSLPELESSYQQFRVEGLDEGTCYSLLRFHCYTWQDVRNNRMRVIPGIGITRMRKIYEVLDNTAMLGTEPNVQV